MVQECAHLYENGRKCRRIPKRGQPLCPAHRSPRRRRSPLEENEAFMEEIFAFAGRLKAMAIDDLLYATGEMLANIHVLIDRRSSRRDRMDYCRATSAITVTADRIADIAIARRAHLARAQAASALPATTQPIPIRPPQPATSPVSSKRYPPDPILMERVRVANETLSHAPDSPQHLTAYFDELLSIIDASETTTSTLQSNT
jgi:hypothetical protein